VLSHQAAQACVGLAVGSSVGLAMLAVPVSRTTTRCSKSVVTLTRAAIPASRASIRSFSVLESPPEFSTVDIAVGSYVGSGVGSLVDSLVGSSVGDSVGSGHAGADLL